MHHKEASPSESDTCEAVITGVRPICNTDHDLLTTRFYGIAVCISHPRGKREITRLQEKTTKKKEQDDMTFTSLFFSILFPPTGLALRKRHTKLIPAIHCHYKEQK